MILASELFVAELLTRQLHVASLQLSRLGAGWSPTVVCFGEFSVGLGHRSDRYENVGSETTPKFVLRFAGRDALVTSTVQYRRQPAAESPNLCRFPISHALFDAISPLP